QARTPLVANDVTPAEAGAQTIRKFHWFPAFAGMTTILMLSALPSWADTAASAYNPAWGGELSWVNSELFSRPFDSFASLGGNSLETNYLPWWVTDVAHPIKDYDASKLGSGSVRLDSAIESEVTFHRLLPGWTKQTSPTGIDNVYTFTPGSTSQEDTTSRAGQAAYLNLGLHPVQSISADIGAELQGNYD